MTPVTALILTFNEAPNIARTLSRLDFATEIVVVDSCSTDGTQAIASGFERVRVIENRFTSLAEQWTFGLEQTGITTDWVLALDADYVLTDEAIAELRTFAPDAAAAGFRASFIYCVHGRPLRSSVYPPVTVLFRRALTTVEQDGHCQRARVRGEIRELRGHIQHDDRKSLLRWLSSQVAYMRLESHKLERTAWSDLATIDRLRHWIVVAPPAVLIYCLIVRRGILDGWPGWFYALQRTTAELVLSLTLIERRFLR